MVIQININIFSWYLIKLYEISFETQPEIENDEDDEIGKGNGWQEMEIDCDLKMISNEKKQK